MARKNGVRRLVGTLPAFEEWTPPWKDDEFDAEKAKKLIYDLQADKQTLFEQIDERDSSLSEIKDERDDLLDEVEKLGKSSKKGDGDGEGEGPSVADQIKEALAAAGIGTTKSRKEQRREAEQADQSGDLTSARLEIALDKGLTRAQAMRLQGTSREELEADADLYMEEHGLGGGDAGEGNDGEGGEAPARQGIKVSTGSRRQSTEQPDPYDGQDMGKLYDEIHGR